MSDIWMTSNGLDVSFDEPNTEEYIKVQYGELEGTFRSMHAKNNRLTFEVSDIELALNYIKSSPDEASIVYSNFLHKVNWDHHNYSVEKAGKYTLLVTVENAA